jgi:molybdopterin-guanine dinucleotide biosynthesis protein A
MKITGVIIAGGQSLRMGRDKKNIQYSGKTFLERAIELLSNITDEVVISSNDDIPGSFHVIKDEKNGIGPMGGIYSVLKNIQNELALIIPADLPLLDEEILQFLISKYDRNSKACVFEINNQLEALVGLYHKDILPFMEQQIAMGEYKMQELLEKIIAQKVNGDAFKDKFLNINTPHDLDLLDNV